MAPKKRSNFNFGTDPAEVDAATYGELSGLDWNKIDSDKLTIEAISIEMIEPDFRQPRRTMPTAVRKLWKSSNLADMMLLFGNWLNMAKVETEEPFPLEKLLGAEGEGQDGSELEAEHFPIYYNLMQTTQLAAAIKRDKLKNPITVYRVGDTYKIETGERRWLAFQLLEYFYGDGHWEKIAAKVGQYDVWGQATENNQRSSLNAIGKARQFALLLMQLYPEQEWKTYEEFESDLEFYAQVADGDQWRIPRGKGGQLMNAMGEQTPQRLREYRMLLRLDQRTWEKADDGNWKLGAVLNFVRPPGYTVQKWTVSDDHTAQIRAVSADDSFTMQGQENARVGDSGAAGEGFTQSSFELPGEKRAAAAGLYPSSTPVKPIGRGETNPTKPLPKFQLNNWVRIKSSGQATNIMNMYWDAPDWRYQIHDGTWVSEHQLEKAMYVSNEERDAVLKSIAPRTLNQSQPAQSIPTPSPSPLSGEGNEEDEDWGQKPVKSTEVIFDKETLMHIRDLAKLTEQEIWQWVTTYGYGLPDFMTWHNKVETALLEALALAEDTAIAFDTEWKTQKRGVSE